MFYWILKIIGGPILRAIYRPWVRGLENVPDEGPVIMASNHLAAWDSVFLPLVLPRKIVFLGKQEYFMGHGFKGRLQTHFMRAIGTIPVDRSGGKAGEAAILTGLKELEKGIIFGIYPEGTRSPDGRLYRGKTGVARLSLRSGVPVIPVAMIGTSISQPVGTRIPRIKPVGVVIGKPMDFSRYAGMENDRFVLRSITDDVMYQLLLQSGQEYVDVYAATMKGRLAAGAAAPAGEDEAAATQAPGGRSRPEVSVPEPPVDAPDEANGAQ